MDVRTRFTKMAIEDAFISLLEEKPIRNITVKELCERAQINRGTFYRYYHDPIDLLESIEERILGEIVASIAIAPADLESHFIALLNDIKVTHRKYQVLFSENGDQGFLLRFVALSYERAVRELDQDLPSADEMNDEWRFSFLMQGCSGVISTWIDNGMVEAPEEVAAFLVQSISSVPQIRPASNARSGTYPL